MAQIRSAERACEMAVLAQVVEDGSFSRAARSLRRSPSAVSKLVAWLENRLGLRLIQRTTRRLALTAEDRLFYDRCREICSRLSAVVRRVLPHAPLKLE